MMIKTFFSSKIFLLISSGIIIFLLTKYDSTLNVFLVSIYYLSTCILYVLITYTEKEEVHFSKKSNALAVVLYSIFGFLLSTDLMNKDSYLLIYPLESLIVLCASLISISSLLVYLKFISQTSKKVYLLIFFVFLIYRYTDHSLVYIFYSSDNIIRPLYTAIGLFILSLGIYYVISLKIGSTSILKKFYIGIVFIYLLLNLLLLSLFIFDIPNNIETSLPLSIGILILNLLVNFYSIKILIKKNGDSYHLKNTLHPRE